MKTIKRFAITRATHGEMANLAEKIITILTASLSENTFILGILALLQRSLEKLNLALTAVRENSYVASLNQQDEIRDDAYIMFQELNKAECQADIELLNAKVFYDDLTAAQDDYEAIAANLTSEDVLKITQH